ncbi:putative aminopeptidase npepl1 [Dinochytrium kinnereticum]|nr:putative aminopeptidase npepl1 [Dinochytrium kinnereticum]
MPSSLNPSQSIVLLSSGTRARAMLPSLLRPSHIPRVLPISSISRISRASSSLSLRTRSIPLSSAFQRPDSVRELTVSSSSSSSSTRFLRRCFASGLATPGAAFGDALIRVVVSAEKEIAVTPDTKVFAVVGEKKLLDPKTSEALTQSLTPLSLPAGFTDPIFKGAESSVTQLIPTPGGVPKAAGDGKSEPTLPFTAVSVATVPEASGRNMGIIRGDAILDAVKKAVGKSGDAVVIVRVKGAEEALAAALSAARAVPLFTRKTDEKLQAPRTVRLHIATADGSAVDNAAIQIAVDAARFSASLVDTPPNELHTDAYLDRVKQVHSELLSAKGVTLTAIRGEELKEKGYGLIYGVGQASIHPPVLIILSHVPSTASKSLALVGKGIVFDTGGLSLKPTAGMCTMKTDMAGSAGLLGAFVAAVMGGTGGGKVALHCVLCVAENTLGERSFRNDDVLKGYSGKTVEINNTDAEGRLVLADGISHATKHLNPDYVVDMATLTGAQAFATGRRHAGVLSNSGDFEKIFVDAGRRSGDLLFPLIYAPEFHGISKQFERGVKLIDHVALIALFSEVADMKNSVKERADVGSSSAGLFIQAHMSPEEKWKEGGEGMWAHVDMAFPSTNPDGRGSGFGVGLLLEVIKTIAAKL